MNYQILFLKMLLLVLTTTMVFSSCGPRKVELERKSITEEISSSVIDKTIVTELKLSKEEYSNLIYDVEVQADSITTNKQGETKFYNPKIKSKGQKQEGKKDELSNIDIKNDIEEGVIFEKKEDVKIKNTERKQFNWWLAVVPFIIIIISSYFTIKYIKKQKSRLL